MPFLPTASRRTAISGVWAVATRIALLALCMAALMATTAKDLVHSCLPPQSGQHVSAGVPEKEAPPLTCRSGSRTSPDALRPPETTPQCLDSRQSETGTFLVSKGELPGSRLSGWLRHLGVQQPACSQLSLQVLFCTWQA